MNTQTSILIIITSTWVVNHTKKKKTDIPLAVFYDDNFSNKYFFLSNILLGNV